MLINKDEIFESTSDVCLGKCEFCELEAHYIVTIEFDKSPFNLCARHAEIVVQVSTMMRYFRNRGILDVTSTK